MKEKDFISIEEYFNHKRGSPTLLSPMDWQLIDQWRKIGIPLKIIYQGIDRSFEKFKKTKKKGRKINSIAYCNQEVLKAWDEYKELIVGKNPEAVGKISPEKLWRQKVENKLINIAKNLDESAIKVENEEKEDLGKMLKETAKRVKKLSESLKRNEIDIQYCHQQLETLDNKISTALIASALNQEIEKAKAIADQELKEYKGRMEHNIYNQVIDNFIRQYLSYKYGIPRINIFI